MLKFKIITHLVIPLLCIKYIRYIFAKEIREQNRTFN